MADQIQFALREMQPTDSKHVAELMTEDKHSFFNTHFILDTYTVLTQGDSHETRVIVAEAAGYDGLAGIATASFGQVQFEDQVLPFASLDSWQVAQRFRKQGLASRLVKATIDAAEAQFGEDIVLAAGLATTNDASRATASKWCREFFEPLQATVAPIRQRPPGPIAGITVREAHSEDFPQIVERQNAFYTDYNLYEPLTVESLQSILDHAPGGARMYHYWIAENAVGDILAGVLLRQRSVLMIEKVNAMPLPLRLANLVMRFIPDDQTMRLITTQNLWYTSGQTDVARHFWQVLRWDLRDKGSSLSAGYDPRSLLAAVFKSRPPFQPRFHIALAIRGPVMMSPDRLVAAPPRR